MIQGLHKYDLANTTKQGMLFLTLEISHLMSLQMLISKLEWINMPTQSRPSSADLSFIRTINMHIHLIIKMIDMINVMPYMTVMTDILALDDCHGIDGQI